MKQEICWKESEACWDKQAVIAKKTCPIQEHASTSKVLFIVPGEQRFLRLRGATWLFFRKGGFRFIRHFLFHPFSCLFRYLRAFVKKSCEQQDDYFFYGTTSVKHFINLFEDSILLVGFSYCQKPLECPSKRFTSDCAADFSSLICQQCIIGKAKYLFKSDRAFITIIPTVKDIANTLLDLKGRFPSRRILFLIATCELAMRMFAEFAAALGVQGIGIRLHGRFCNTQTAFKLSERGIKPGRTSFEGDAETQFFSLLQEWILTKFQT